MKFRLIDGVEVDVEDVLYDPLTHLTAEKPHTFQYFIRFDNYLDEPIRIIGRKWILDTFRSKFILEGDGVVGQFPVIQPGGSFRYDSYHIISETSLVYGAFYGVTQSGVRFYLDIVPFDLHHPDDM